MAKSMRVRDVFTGKSTVLDDSSFNDSMRQWASQVQRMAKDEASSFTHGKRSPSHTYKSGKKKGSTELKLRTHISYALKADYGEVAGIAFRFPVHGIFREYGVNRYHRRGNPISTSDWMSGALQRNEEKLLDIVADHEADKFVRTFMGIKK